MDEDNEDDDEENPEMENEIFGNFDDPKFKLKKNNNKSLKLFV